MRPGARALHAAHGTQVEAVRHPGNRNARIFHDTEQPAALQAVPTGFVVPPKRWVVERTHAWNERCRRLVMHHDRNPLIATAWVWFAQARVLVSTFAD